MSSSNEGPRGGRAAGAPEGGERLFEGVKFAVERRQVPTRDGGTAMREVVVHPGAVVVLPILDDGRIVMIRNHRFAVDETLWELCAGTLEPGEEPAVTAARELVEETGYSARSIEPFTTFYTSPGICDEIMYAYLARGLTEVGQQLEATEQIEVELLTHEEVMRLVEEGQVRDGKTIATLLYYQAFRRAG